MPRQLQVDISTESPFDETKFHTTNRKHLSWNDVWLGMLGPIVRSFREMVLGRRSGPIIILHGVYRTQECSLCASVLQNFQVERSILLKLTRASKLQHDHSSAIENRHDGCVRLRCQALKVGCSANRQRGLGAKHAKGSGPPAWTYKADSLGPLTASFPLLLSTHVPTLNLLSYNVNGRIFRSTSSK